MMAPLLTADRLREVLDYDPETGIFVWRKNGVIAGSQDDEGYIRIKIDQRRHQAHRLAWLYIHSFIPKCELDHVNGQRGDNRIANLRPATKAQNQYNCRRHSRNKSGYKGVYWAPASGKWRAEIKVGKKIYLGLFSDPAEGHAAYCEAAKRHFGEFARAE